MSVAELGLIAVAYAYFYHFLARGAISRVLAVDSSYSGRWAAPTIWANPKNSLAILHIMFNMNLPRESYPTTLKWRIWVARVMLWMWTFVVLAVLFFGKS